MAMAFLWNSWNVLRGYTEEKRTASVNQGRAFLIATYANLLDNNYEFCRFNDGLKDIIT